MWDRDSSKLGAARCSGQLGSRLFIDDSSHCESVRHPRFATNFPRRQQNTIPASPLCHRSEHVLATQATSPLSLFLSKSQQIVYQGQARRDTAYPAKPLIYYVRFSCYSLPRSTCPNRFTIIMQNPIAPCDLMSFTCGSRLSARGGKKRGPPGIRDHADPAWRGTFLHMLYSRETPGRYNHIVECWPHDNSFLFFGVKILIFESLHSTVPGSAWLLSKFPFLLPL
jgi:hypothetical protein